MYETLCLLHVAVNKHRPTVLTFTASAH